MKILITGAAGFIGFHTVQKFIEQGHDVVGIDNINNYYNPNLKYARLNASGITRNNINRNVNTLKRSSKWPKYQFLRIDIENSKSIMKLFQNHRFDLVIHLAAQAGVRYSIENPMTYIQSNVVGFINILEGCRNYNVNRLFYASSSSVYGQSNKATLSINDRVDFPLSLYAATKKSNELMAHAYNHLFKIQTVGLRFFTVYGPWGRPDMAPILFTNAIVNQKPIQVFNNGNLWRDFTFIGDIVESIYGLVLSLSDQKYKIFNLGNSSPILLLDFIQCLENEIGKPSIKILVDMQPGDVISTCADTTELIEVIGYKPKTNIKEGVKEFIKWYQAYFKNTKL